MGRTLAATGMLVLGLIAVQASGAGSRSPAAAVPAICTAGVEHPLGNDRIAYAGIVRNRAIAYGAPGRRPFATFGRSNVNGYPSFFGVLAEVMGPDCKPAWYRVELPLRPNGTTGYVRASAIELGLVHTRILVDISSHRLTLYRDGRRVLETVTAVGKSSTPTPLGSYYVNQRLRSTDPAGPYGPAAIGVSAFSNVLTGWAQGGPIGIHGTNEPWLLGQSVSDGCVRLANAVLSRLFSLTPAGTPVIIRA